MLVPGHGYIATSQAEILKRKKDSLHYIHQLRTCLEKNESYEVNDLWKRYKFPRIMTQFHEGNVKLMGTVGLFVGRKEKLKIFLSYPRNILLWAVKIFEKIFTAHNKSHSPN